MADSSTADLSKGKRITGDDRTSLADELRERYAGGESIRLLATSTNRSYGFVHRLLSGSGATLRGRGGGHREAEKNAGAPARGKEWGGGRGGGHAPPCP